MNPTSAAPYGNWNIVWSDEFNGTVIDTNTWTYDLGNGGSNPGWGNNELEYYTSRTNNAYVAGGLLHIVAQQESTNGFGYTSARLKTQGLAAWTYGRFEWRARLPAGTGFWPALWCLGTNITSVGWPGCGEMDVMENNGAAVTNVQGSLHSGSDETAVYTFPPGGSVTNFHNYVLDWSTNAFLFYVDGHEWRLDKALFACQDTGYCGFRLLMDTMRCSPSIKLSAILDGHLYEMQTNWASSLGDAYPSPFDQPCFIIMNLAVGGNYVGNPSVAAINTNGGFPADLQVDYLRVYNPTSPLKISLARTNNALLVSWPSNIVGHLQAQINPTGGLGSNWSDQTQYSNPARLYPTNGSGFYRVRSP